MLCVCGLIALYSKAWLKLRVLTELAFNSRTSLAVFCGVYTMLQLHYAVLLALCWSIDWASRVDQHQWRRQAWTRRTKTPKCRLAATGKHTGQEAGDESVADLEGPSCLRPPPWAMDRRRHGTSHKWNALQNVQSDCHQWLSHSFRVHQIRFRFQPRLCPRPRWGSLPQTS